MGMGLGATMSPGYMGEGLISPWLQFEKHYCYKAVSLKLSDDLAVASDRLGGK